MSPEPVVKRFHLAGLPVAATNMDGLIAAVRNHFATRTEATPGTFVVFRDAHGVVRAQRDAALRAAHEDALLVCADGWPIAAAGRVLGFRDVAQVPGIEALAAVCRAGLASGWRHYFLGGTPDVLQRLVHRLQQRMPGLQVAALNRRRSVRRRLTNRTPPAPASASRAPILSGSASVRQNRSSGCTPRRRICRARSPWASAPPSTSTPASWRALRHGYGRSGWSGSTAPQRTAPVVPALCSHRAEFSLSDASDGGGASFGRGTG